MNGQATPHPDAGSTARRHPGLAVAGAGLLGSLLLLAGCNGSGAPSRAGYGWAHHDVAFAATALPRGARITVALACNLSSGSARVGDAWHGTVTEFVRNGGESVIPPGSEVTGTVTGVSPARWDAPAMLVLAVRNVRVNGQDESILASAEPLIAGSAGARNVCPTGAGFAGGSSTGQVVLTDVTVITFTVDQAVAMQ